MLQARSMFSCNQNGWSYSVVCRSHLLFALSKEGASRSITGIDRRRYGTRHETVRVGQRLPKGYQKKAPDPSVQVRGLQTPCFSYSHSMASVLPSRHSSYTQFSASTRNACRRMTRCRVSSASGTKAGTTSKTFFKLRALSFCFCPKVRGGSPLEARWRRKRPF